MIPIVIIIILSVFILAKICIDAVFIHNLMGIIKEQKETIDWYKEHLNKVRETNEMAVKLAQDCVKDSRQCSDAVKYAANFLKPRKKLRMLRIANGKEPLF